MSLNQDRVFWLTGVCCSLLTSRRVGGGALQLLDDVDIQQLKRQKILTNEQQVTNYKASL